MPVTKQSAFSDHIACVQHVRIEVSKQMLKLNTGSVEYLATVVGYLDPAAFWRVFRKCVRTNSADQRLRFTKLVPPAKAGQVGKM